MTIAKRRVTTIIINILNLNHGAPARNVPPVRPPSRDVIVQFPRHRAGRQTIGDSRASRRGSPVASIESDMCSPVFSGAREISARRKVWHVYAYWWLQCTSLFTAICKGISRAERMAALLFKNRSFHKSVALLGSFGYRDAQKPWARSIDSN